MTDTQSPELPQGDTIRLLTPSDDIDTMARCLFDLWHDYDPAETLETCRADLLEGLEPSVKIPKTFVYRQGGKVAGWASIINVEIQDRPDFGPWLANLTVLPDFRGQGIARALTRHVMDYAKGVTDVLYLYTDTLEASYAKLGWRTERQIHIGAKPVTLMAWEPRG